MDNTKRRSTKLLNRISTYEARLAAARAAQELETEAEAGVFEIDLKIDELVICDRAVSLLLRSSSVYRMERSKVANGAMPLRLILSANNRKPRSISM